MSKIAGVALGLVLLLTLGAARAGVCEDRLQFCLAGCGKNDTNCKEKCYAAYRGCTDSVPAHPPTTQPPTSLVATPDSKCAPRNAAQFCDQLTAGQRDRLLDRWLKK